MNNDESAFLLENPTSSKTELNFVYHAQGDCFKTLWSLHTRRLWEAWRCPGGNYMYTSSSSSLCKKAFFYVHLKQGPPLVNCHRKNNLNCIHLGHGCKGLFVVHPVGLSKALSHQSCFIVLNRSVWVKLDLVDPPTTHWFLHTRKLSDALSMVVT